MNFDAFDATAYCFACREEFGFNWSKWTTDYECPNCGSDRWALDPDVNVPATHASNHDQTQTHTHTHTESTSYD